MANEISYRHSRTGKNIYFTIRDASNRQYYNGSTFEALTVANWGTYDIALSETPASSYFYVGDFPFLACGWYYVELFERAGGSPAIGDELVAAFYGYWCQSKFEPAGSDMKQIASDTYKATALKNALNAVNNNIQANMKFWDDTAVSKSSGGLPSVNTEEVGGTAQSPADLFTEISNLDSKISGSLGTDGKALISTDKQDLADTLRVDSGVVCEWGDVSAVTDNTHITCLSIVGIADQYNGYSIRLKDSAAGSSTAWYRTIIDMDDSGNLVISDEGSSIVGMTLEFAVLGPASSGGGDVTLAASQPNLASTGIALDASVGDVAADTVTALKAELFDGVAFENIVKYLLSMTKGKIVKSESAYSFYNQAGNTVLFTLTETSTERTPS